MSFATIGHNRRGSERMCALVFDFDMMPLQRNRPGSSWNNACDDVRRYLAVREFTRMRGSTSFGDDPIDAVRRIGTVRRLAKRHQWYTPSVRDLRMLRTEENNDLRIALDEDDD